MTSDGATLDWSTLGIALVLVGSSVILLVCATRSSRCRNRAWLRLDWFLPVLRKPRSGDRSAVASRWTWLKRCTPASLWSDPETKRRGAIRRVLRRLGISWLASPPRRIVQTLCLVLFLFLFFYVCWPYRARPPQAGIVSTGWTFARLLQKSGRLEFERQSEQPFEVDTGTIVYLFDQAADDERAGRAGEFRVVSAGSSTLLLVPENNESAESFDAVLTGIGPWTIRETDPTAWPSHYADDFAVRESVPVELFLMIDPLVSLSTAIASRSAVWSLTSAAVILIVCLVIPRGFCGYLCPLGTTIDLFDWLIGRRVTRFRVSGDGWWVHIKYYLLAGTLISALAGVLLSGVVSAIPVLTRGVLFFLEPAQTAILRGTYAVPPLNLGHIVSMALFLCVLGLGFLRPRFWCKYVCPSGAIFSVGNLFRITERKVEASCIHCNKCIEICPFDAIKPDFTTRTTDCTLCQSCGGVCPTHAIKFVERTNRFELKPQEDPPTGETKLGRRGFLSLGVGGAGAIAGGLGAAGLVHIFGADPASEDAYRPVRPPGSVPEQDFLQMCIRCGECFKVCPNNVLQAEGFQQGLEGLWTPMVKADWAGCEPSCNSCGQVCPTGAIRALPLEEKRTTRMGLAEVDPSTCLPLAGQQECDLCVQECNAAGYEAIEFIRVGTQVDEHGAPIEGSGFLAPRVIAELCVGCGLCQTRCHHDNVTSRRLLAASAIIVVAGAGKEDRLLPGEQPVTPREPERGQVPPATHEPQSAPASDSNSDSTSDPFGL